MILRCISVAVVVLLAQTAWAGVEEFKDDLVDDYGLELSGFLEGGYGSRIHHDPYEKATSLAEARLQLEMGKSFDWGVWAAKGDLTGDGVLEDVSGRLRELNLAFTPLDNMDVKLGRQVVTWGTADMVFINDLFPKDWQSFFIGRDDEFLKAATDAVRARLFLGAINVDTVYVPIEQSSTHITGDRLSYWNGVLGRLAGRDYDFKVDERSRAGRDSEYSLRLYGALASNELALYGYWGFWKTPEAMDGTSLRLCYPRLDVYGASLRGPMLGGIAHLELGYYDSRQDGDGDDPLVRNSEVRLVAGLEKELGHNFTAATQYYLEWLQDYDEYEWGLAPGAPGKDEWRHVFTLRLTKLLYNQNLTLSFFGYYSPSDHDGYLRPNAQYKLSDQWQVETGGNIFFGREEYTFFGQFEANSNIYARLRWQF